ncbi:TlpA family protein disulfide reductase [Thiohalomonas denitrificans]|uniref:Peroxiredoxin n=1 Tax=Thiohalomonas denitrificans TaxID=415747 RepID=A0A1G5QHS9_9GAMM|nr:TlpA disulfide reductase family protein [Thiohalomonas denitrificans]SCZ61252.1 Peroxiredoxin [Thiohalomonas denitrificans]
MRFYLCLLSLLVAPVFASELAEPLFLDTGAEIPIERYSGADAAHTRVLWLPSEEGLQSRELAVARELAATGPSVWAADLHTAYFLAAARTSLEQVPVEDVVSLIEAAAADVQQLFLFTSGRGAALALQAARAWQLEHPGSERLAGAVLVHPNLQKGLPEPGEPPSYRPVTTATNLPIYLFQPGLSAKRWHLSDLARGLASGGSDLFQHFLPSVSDGFMNREQPDDAERAMNQQMPALIARAVRLLEPYAGPRQAPALVGSDDVDAEAGLAAGLRPYTGDPAPPELNLPGLQGETFDLQSYEGRVVLVNFWATWCPPCVHEIPSLGRLQEQFEEQGFSVLAVDVGEDEVTVRRFLEKRPVAFPVLLDLAGEAVNAWNVSAFPTNFLIDAQGRIRYSYYGALEWDAPEVVAIVKKLLAEMHEPAR